MAAYGCLLISDVCLFAVLLNIPLFENNNFQAAAASFNPGSEG